MAGREEALVSPSDIALIAGVSRGAVSNWRKRDTTFPESVAGTASKPLFSLNEVNHWLELHATRTGNESIVPRDDGASAMDLWASLNSLREHLSVDEAADLVLALAVARRSLGVPDVTDLEVAAETVDRVREAVDRFDARDLADVVDFTLERLARSQTKMGAEFGFVGSRTTAVLAKLASSMQGGTLYDPACGIGTALLAALAGGARAERVVGHDVNRRAVRIAGQRADLRGIELELTLTDVLADDVDPKLKADVVVLEPPFGLRMSVSLRLTDRRFEFGTPPRSSADLAWLQHAVAHLSDHGRAYVLTPHGPLFRGGEEGRIRTELVRRGCVEAVIGLPGKMLPHTSIPLALWVLRRPVPSTGVQQVLLIDASDAEFPERDVRQWLDSVETRGQVPHVEAAVTDILADGAVLTPSRWLARIERDPHGVTTAYLEGWSQITDTMRKLQNVLKSYAHFADFSTSRVFTVGELIEEGVLELRQGRPADRYDSAPEALHDRIATAADVHDGNLHELGLDEDYNDYPELTQERDVLVTTLNAVRARVDAAGGHLPGLGVSRLRVRDREVLSPSYLAAVLGGSWNQDLHAGTTMQRAHVKDLQVPLLPVTEQDNLYLAMVSLGLVLEHAEQLRDESSTVMDALLDAVRYNAPLTESPGSVSGNHQDGRDDDEGAT